MNIKKDKNKGTYYFVISAGFNSEGNRRQIKRTGFKGKKQAEEAYLRIKSELAQESFVDPNNVTFGDYYGRWKLKKKLQIEESSFIRYERLCRLHIIPAIGSMKLQKITSAIVQNLIDHLAIERGFARKSCLLVTTIINDLFKKAIKEGLVTRNPVEGIDLPKKTDPEIVIWDEENVATFLGVRNDRQRSKYYVAVLMALLTGMRKGEILGLTWDKVDFGNGIITISQILESDGSKLSQKTKGKKVRKVTMPDLLKQALIEHIEFQKKDSPTNPDNLVFCTRRGKRVIPNTLNDVLNSMCEKYDLPRMKFHDLRHTHATMLIKENINIKVIQERLGHSKASVTLDIYSHLLPSMQHSVTEKLNKMFECDSTVTKSS
ncbi:tyrosine-type recombinase/integrase [Mesobacillus zeae]|uniref:site-specific integrase n=1 Tax=Mesobacillus zeae TaxID=1917180 RepID=UPI00300B490A